MSNSRVTRAAAIVVFASSFAAAQAPRAMFPWWDRPLARGLNLTDAQRSQIRSTVLEYRPELMKLRASVQKAEADLQNCFNADQVNVDVANKAIDNLADARRDLIKEVSQMALRLRLVLTRDQWTAVQQRRRDMQTRPRGPRDRQ